MKTQRTEKNLPFEIRISFSQKIISAWELMNQQLEEIEKTQRMIDNAICEKNVQLERIQSNKKEIFNKIN